jgi:uncharacterized membrane protein YphA (DoxX/SURF4 family)
MKNAPLTQSSIPLERGQALHAPRRTAAPARHCGAERSTSMATQGVVTARTAVWALSAVYLLFAYEWLISAFNKLLSADFRPGLASQLQTMVADNPLGWYVRFLNRAVIPHAETFALVIEWSEVAVGLGFILGAARLLGGARLGPRLAFWCDLALIAALAGSAVMTLNYWFLTGHDKPWLDASAVFDEGITIDGLLALISIALLVIQIQSMRLTRRANHQPA